MSARGRRTAGLLCALPLALLMLVLLAPAAAAHAVLVGSEPAAGATVTTAPSTVRLRFSEDISRRFSSARLVDRDGRGVGGTRVETDGGGSRVLVLDLPAVGAGAYGVLWQVLAEDDGHTTSGVVVFSVGDASAGSGSALGVPAAAGGEAVASAADVARRWLGVSLLAGMIGALAVAGPVLGRAGSGHRGGPLAVAVATARRRLLTLAAWCAALGAAVGVADAIAKADRQAPPGAGSRAAVLELLVATRWGHLWLLRGAALVALAVLAHRLRSWIGGTGPRRRHGPGAPTAAVAVLVIAVVLVEAAGSHASGLGRGRVAAIGVDAVHILAACLWLGALPALAVLLRTPSRGEAGPGELLLASRGALTVLAAGSVGLVVVTGLYGAGLEVETVDGLLTTRYGRALLVKTALLLIAGVLGLVNSVRLHGRSPSWLGPAGARVAARWPSRRLVMIEAGAGALLLVAVGVLLESVPARGMVAAAPAAPAAVESASGSAADLVVTVSVTPNRPGVNGFTVLAASSRRPPPAPVEEVAVQPGVDARAIALREVSAGRWFGTGRLDQPGSLRLRAVVRRAGERLAVPLPWWVGPPVVTTPPPGPAPGRRLAPYLDGMALSLLVGALAIGARWLVTIRRRARPAVVSPSRPPEPARRA